MELVFFYITQAKAFRWRARMAPTADLKAKHRAAAMRMLESARETVLADNRTL